MKADLRAVTDEQLVTILAGQESEAAYSELFRRYQKKVYLWCFNYTHDVEEAVDCTQEIFIRIFKNLASFAGRSSFSTWVYRITKNYCLGLLSRKQTQWRKKQVAIDDLNLADTDCTERLQEADLKGELEKLLAAANKNMKTEELQAFVLHYQEGLTVKEITKILGCENVTGARTLIQNARRKFQRLIKGKDYTSD